MRVLCNAAGGFGHLYPLASLARTLIEAGHDVALAVPGYFAEEARETGLQTVALKGDGVTGPSARHKARQDSRPAFERSRAALERYLDQGLHQVPALRRAIAAWRPDVLARETTAYAGWLTAELTGIPTAVLDFAPTPAKLLAATAGDLFDAARTAVGLPRDPTLATLTGGLHLLAAPVGWFSPRVMGPTTHLVQPLTEPPAAGEHDAVDWWWAGQSHWPRVYATLGTVYNTTPGLFRMIFEAAHDEPIRVLATVGRDVDPTSFGPVPNHIRVEHFVPQPAILRHADAVISHSGYGTLMGSLRRGIPVVTMPLGAADGVPNAARLTALGAGIALHERERSAPALRDALRTVLHDPRYRQAAAQVAAAIAAQPTMREKVPLIEQLPVATAAPARSFPDGPDLDGALPGHG